MFRINISLTKTTVDAYSVVELVNYMMSPNQVVYMFESEIYQ